MNIWKEFTEDDANGLSFDAFHMKSWRWKQQVNMIVFATFNATN